MQNLSSLESDVNYLFAILVLSIPLQKNFQKLSQREPNESGFLSAEK